MMPEILSRRVPGHVWARAGFTFHRGFERGHCWQYHGIIRRDAWKLGPLGIYLLRMPNQVDEEIAKARMP
jgi:hypothetical protein